MTLSDGTQLHPLIESLPNYKKPVLPIMLLVQPLKKRFQYHFYGNKQTNSLEKVYWKASISSFQTPTIGESYIYLKRLE